MKPQEAIFKEMDDLSDRIAHFVMCMAELNKPNIEELKKTIRQVLDEWTHERVKRIHWEGVCPKDISEKLEEDIKSNNNIIKLLQSPDLLKEVGLEFCEKTPDDKLCIVAMLYTLDFGTEWQENNGYKIDQTEQ